MPGPTHSLASALLLASTLLAQTPAHTHTHADAAKGSPSWKPDIAVIGNFTGRLDDRRVRNEDGDAISDRFNLREVELDIRAPIDAFASGVLILAAEAERPGDYEIGVEEGYVRLHRLPGLEESPMDLRFRVGRFRPSIGMYNRLHTHELPHTSRPHSLRTFLGDEGFIQNGVEATVDLLQPGHQLEISLDASFLNGGEIAIGAANDGEDPSYALRLQAALDLSEEHDIYVGIAHYDGKRDAAGLQDAHLYAVDATYRWQPHEIDHTNALVIGFEGYLADLEQTAAPADTPFGGFAYAQYQIGGGWYAGVRYDYAEMLDDDSKNTKSMALFATYYFSETLRLRAGWERFASDEPTLDGLDTAWLELNFVFGAHPPHPFRVHR